MSVMVMVPARLPPAVGAKVTEIVQFAPAATLVPQVLVWAKSPLAAMLVTLSVALPLLESVTTCEALVDFSNCPVKVRLAADKLSTGPIPVPVSATVWVLSATALLLSVTVSVPVRLPKAVGVNVKLMVQLAPPARGVVVLQVPPEATPKSPEAAMALISNGADPVLLSVADWVLLVVPTPWLPKLRLAGATEPRDI